MSETRDKLVKEIFLTALEKPDGPERAAYLAQACEQDAPLRERVTDLLRLHAQAGDFLETPVTVAPELAAIATTGLTEKPGDEIGYYKLLQQIGEGGCGVVYLAEQKEPIRRRVALKVIKLGMDTKQVVARFEAERQALALMDHPNIAKIFDAGVIGAPDSQPSTLSSQLSLGRPYFVMELVRGIKITDYCDENNLRTEERLRLFVQICHAIQHAHQKGIIHRDIKPSNILVTINDGVPVPKVIDFGIAKAIGQELTDKTVLTAFQQFIGTPAYMSPEQALMTSLDVDTRSDIYGLGVLLYELLTGRTPFDQKELVAAGLDEMRRIIREKEPVRPSTRLGTLTGPEQTTIAQRRHSQPPELIHLLSGDLDWIVMKCLEKDRARRYETANSLAEDVVRHLQDEPIVARPPGRVYRLQKLVRRNKLTFAAVAAVSAALVIGLGLSTWLFFKEQAAHRRAVAAEKIQSQLREQAQAEARKSEEVARFLTDMLGGVGPSVAMGRETTLLKEILDKTVERVGRDLTSQPEVEAELRSTLGDVYFALGQSTNAAAMHRAALSLRRALWDNLNTNVADSLFGLGQALLSPEAPDQVEPLFLEALSIRTNLLGAEHPKVALSLAGMGFLRVNQGRPFEAEVFYRQALAMRRKLLGTNHIEVARNLSSLSMCLNNQYRSAEAEKAAREALAIQITLSGTEAAWDALVSQSRLVIALSAQKKLEEAEPVARQNLKSTRTILGPEHLNSLVALNGLAGVLAGNGKLEEAEGLAQESVALSKRVFGTRYPTPQCLGNLGGVLQKAGKLAEAERAYRESVAFWEQEPAVFQDERSMRFVLIAVLREQGKFRELEAFLGENVAAQRKLATKVARQREATLLRLWADFLREQGKITEAETLYRQGLDISRTVSTNDFWTRQWLAAGLAEVRKNQGKLAEAEALSREALEFARKSSDPGEVALALAALGDLLRDQGKLAEAETIYREAVTNAAKTWPNDFARWEWQFNGLRDLLLQQGKVNEVESVYNELAQIATIPKARQSLMLEIQADVYARQRNFKEAIDYYWRVLQIEPTNALCHLKLAFTLVFTGDLEGYKKLFGETLDRFGENKDPLVCAQVAKACLMLPCSDAHSLIISNWAQLAVTASDSGLRPWAESTMGHAEYRMGHFAQAVTWAQKLAFPPEDLREIKVQSYCILAMAQYRLNRREEARTALAKAGEITRTQLPSIDGSDLGEQWGDNLLARLLLGEAQALIGDGLPPQQTDTAKP